MLKSIITLKNSESKFRNVFLDNQYCFNNCKTKRPKLQACNGCRHPTSCESLIIREPIMQTQAFQEMHRARAAARPCCITDEPRRQLRLQALSSIKCVLQNAIVSLWNPGGGLGFSPSYYIDFHTVYSETCKCTKPSSPVPVFKAVPHSCTFTVLHWWATNHHGCSHIFALAQ